MKDFNTDTKTYKLFRAMYDGTAVTPALAHKRFGIKNIRAEVSRIRSNGFAVYRNQRIAGNGVQVTEYTIGQPDRRIVALGYKAQKMGITL